MDTRTGKVYDIDAREAARTVIGNDGRTYNVIDGENCVNHCKLAFKRNCFTRAPFGRAKCKDFVPSRNV